MKKTLCALLALALCLPAAAEISLAPAGTFSDYAYFEDDSARVVEADADYREGLFDIHGNCLIPCEYEALSGYGVVGYYVAQKEDGLNVRGALNENGNEVIPFQYGDIRFLSKRWALGVTLEETSIRPCDYEDYTDGKGLQRHRLRRLRPLGRGYVGFFSYQCMAIYAHGDFLYVEDRAGETTIYDENLRPVRDGLADPYAAFGSANGDVVNLSTGETILSGYQFGAELGGGLLSVTDGSYLLGVCDLSGRMLTDCRYDRVFAADANGDVRVERDERFGLIDREGNEVVPCEYDGIERLAFGGTYVYRLRGCACVEKDGAYNYVLPDGQLAYPVFYEDVEILGPEHDPHGHPWAKAHTRRRRRAHAHGICRVFPPSIDIRIVLKARGADGLWYLIDWHGNRLLPDGYPYAVSLLIAPDGSAVLAETEDGKLGYAVTR